MIAGDTETNRMPVLLRTKGIDDGKGWERKLELLHEVRICERSIFTGMGN
jgi:hypothetical protein